MSDKLFDEHLATIRDAAAKSRGLFLATCAFALTLGITLLSQRTELAKIERQRADLASQLGQRWQGLEALYEGSRGLVDDYAAEHSSRWSQLAVVLVWEFLTINDNLGAKKDNPTMRHTLDELKTYGGLLHEYNGHVQNIGYALAAGTAFENLPKDVLHSLNAVINFREEDPGFVTALERMRKSSLMLLEVKRPEPLPPRARAILEFGATESFDDLASRVLLRNVRSIGGHQTSDVAQRILDSQIEGLAGGSIGDVRRDAGELARRARQIDEEISITIPVLEVAVPYRALWLAGVMANVFLLASLIGLYRRASVAIATSRVIAVERSDELHRLLASRFVLAPGVSVWKSFGLLVALLTPAALSTSTVVISTLWQPWQVATLVALDLFAIALAISLALEASRLLISPPAAVTPVAGAAVNREVR